MLSLILLMVGAVLYFMGRVSLGNFRAEGRHVRVAGLVLMFPATFTFLLSLFTGLIFARNVDMLLFLVQVLAFVELSFMVVSGIIAYILLAAPAGAPRLPGILGQVQTQRTTAQPEPPRVKENFPSVMNVAQAARYLQMSEADVLALIDAGKLAAARVNYNYRIARMSLDELLESHEAASSS